MRPLAILLLLPLVARAQSSAPREFSAEASHSSVGFSIPFLTGHVKGGFDDLHGILGGSKFNDWFDELRSRTMGDTVDISLELQGWETSFARTTKFDATIARFAKEGITALATRLRTMKAAKQNLDGTDWEIEQLARALLARGKGPDAMELIALGLELFPESVRMQTAAARVYELAGEREKATAATASALAIDAADPRALELKRRLSPPAAH